MFNILILLYGINAQAQDVFIVNKSLPAFRIEKASQDQYRLTADNCEHSYPGSKVPIYRELIPVNKFHRHNIFSLVLIKSLALDPALVKLTDIEEQVPDRFEYKTRLVTVRKKPFIEVEFIPLFKTGPGNIQRVAEYELRVASSSAEGVSESGPKFRQLPGPSVLKQGLWVKLKITQTGIHKITYSELVAMGISDPSRPRIFGNGGRMVPEMNADPRPDGLIENAIWIEKGVDGIFNQGDYLLFYAEGPVVWDYSEADAMFVHTKHLYDEASFYFVTADAGTGKSIPEQGSLTATPTHEVEYYDYCVFREVDTENLIRSGREWFEPISAFTSNSFQFPGSRFQSSATGRILVRTAARSASPTSFEISTGGQSIISLPVSYVNPGNYSSYFAKTASGNTTFTLPRDELEISIGISNSAASESRFWLDYIDLNVRKELYFEGTQMPFRDLQSVGLGATARFHLKNTGEQDMVWDLTDPFYPVRILTEPAGSERTFIHTTDSLREYIVFSPGEAFQAEVMEGLVPNQDLVSVSGMDMIIVSPPEFLGEAGRLAGFRSEQDQMDILIATPESIYNEFSSGKRDAGAIRDFIRQVYKNSSPDQSLKYLLLFGDGSYNNRSDHENNPNRIPTYQSQNSIHYTLSYVTDDFYGLLDDGEGRSMGLIDIGIGRLPVNTVEEAAALVDKIISYTEPQAFGPWRNRICFVGDDGDISDGYTNLHMAQANELCEIVETNQPSFNNQKIFLDAFEKVSSPSGATYPEVNKTLNDAINTGSLIVNYTGHGNERGLAHENILGVNDIHSWTNKYRYPLFITATCEFSRFDDIQQELNGNIALKTSAGEMVLLHREAGGIALLTTTRLVYSYPNFILNKNFYNTVFTTDQDGHRLRLGEVLRITKNQSGSGINKRNFTLLGDPSMTLSFPEHIVQTDSINGKPAAFFTDTLNGLRKYTFKGRITGPDGTLLSDYMGTVYPVIFDKEYLQKTLGNNGNPVMEFRVQDKILYSGKASVNQGVFEFSFIVPKDVSFKSGTGKISYYSKTAQGAVDARGYFGGFEIGGFADTIAEDTTGPVIKLYMNDDKFANGGITDPNPVIYATVTDFSGINTLGTGIGHDITAILDDDFSNPMILNRYYESFIDSYQGGTIRYPLTGLTAGKHTLCLKVWDIYNNASERCLEFEVTTSVTPVLRKLYNYPNPFRNSTSFILEHNLGDSDLQLEILIYNLSGQIINIIKERYYSPGYRLGPVIWDGTDSYGNQVGAGIYIYKVRVFSEAGAYQEISNKLMKVK